MAIRILSSENISGNITIHSPSNAPYIDFVENADTSDSKARITMDQIDTNNGQLIFSTENAGTLTTALTIDSDQNVRTYAKLGIRVDGDAIPWRGTAEIPAVINLAGNGALFTRPDNTFLSQNFYYNASDVGAVIDTGKASLIQLTSGNIIFSNTTSGSSSNATISIVERMRISDDLITFPTVTELRGDIASNKFAIGNMGDASSQMMVSSRGFLTLNVSNTGSAKDATERMRIDGNGVIQLTSGINGYLNTNSIGMEMDINRNPETGAFTDAGLSHARIIMRGDTTANGGSNIKFVTSPTVNTVGITKMTILGSGNVGIATSDPDQKLEVVGSIKIANSNSRLVFGAENGTDRRALEGNTSGSLLQVGESYTDIALQGNVGIGTTSPGAKLEIAGFSTGQGLKFNYGNSSGTIEVVNFIANGGANGVIGMQMVSAGVGDLWLGGSGGRSLTLYRDGNVGIGTDSPNVSGVGSESVVLSVIETSGNRRGILELGDNQNADTGGIGSINFVGTYQDAGHKIMAEIRASGSGATSGQRGSSISMYTKEDGTANIAERMRITSDGSLARNSKKVWNFTAVKSFTEGSSNTSFFRLNFNGNTVVVANITLMSNNSGTGSRTMQSVQAMLSFSYQGYLPTMTEISKTSVSNNGSSYISAVQGANGNLTFLCDTTNNGTGTGNTTFVSVELVSNGVIDASITVL